MNNPLACPHCHYERQAHDRASLSECPACGTNFSRWHKQRAAGIAGSGHAGDQATQRSGGRASTWVPLIAGLVAGLLTIGVCVLAGIALLSTAESSELGQRVFVLAVYQPFVLGLLVLGLASSVGTLVGIWVRLAMSRKPPQAQPLPAQASEPQLPASLDRAAETTQREPGHSRPREVDIACGLLGLMGLGLVLQCTIHGMAIASIVPLLINLGLMAALHQGLNWARIVSLVLFVLNLPSLFFVTSMQLGDTASAVGLIALNGIALWLLFRREAEAWFRPGLRA